MDLSIIVLNYNTSRLTLRCIETLRQHISNIAYEIIVIDNNSSSEEYEILKKGLLKEKVVLFRTRINTGFGSGNMMGAHLAKGKYLCFINSDVEFTQDAVTPLCRYLDEHSEIGCVTPQQYNRYGKPVPSFNHAPGIRHEVLGKKFLEKLFPKHYPRRKRRVYKSPFSVTQINGVFMLFPAKTFFEVGGFDTNIFLYYEEIDICTRLRKLGYKSVVIPQYGFMHLHGEATRKISRLPDRELYISKLYTYKKLHPQALYLIYKWINILKVLAKPKKWYILPALVKGENLSHSMRHQLKGK